MFEKIKDKISRGFVLTLTFGGGEYKAKLIRIERLKASIKSFYGVGMSAYEAIASCESSINTNIISKVSLDDPVMYPYIDKFLGCDDNNSLRVDLDSREDGEKLIRGVLREGNTSKCYVAFENISDVFANLDNSILRDEITEVSVHCDNSDTLPKEA